MFVCRTAYKIFFSCAIQYVRATYDHKSHSFFLRKKLGNFMSCEKKIRKKNSRGNTDLSKLTSKLCVSALYYYYSPLFFREIEVCHYFHPAFPPGFFCTMRDPIRPELGEMPEPIFTSSRVAHIVVGPAPQIKRFEHLYTSSFSHFFFLLFHPLNRDDKDGCLHEQVINRADKKDRPHMLDLRA